MSGNKICDFCKKEFSTPSNAIKHKKICKIKINHDKQEEIERKNKELLEELEKKDEEIAWYKTLLEVCVKKPTIQNNNNTINNNIQNLIVHLDPIDFSQIKDNLHQFNFNKQQRGLEGFAEFLCQDIFNGKIVLTDHSRDIFRYNTTQKKDVRDPKGTHLLSESIRQTPDELLKRFKTTREILEENEMNEENIKKTNTAIKSVIKIKDNIAVSETDFSNVIKVNAIDNMNQKVFSQNTIQT